VDLGINAEIRQGIITFTASLNYFPFPFPFLVPASIPEGISVDNKIENILMVCTY
jgi:hypothetical protein